ncbi:MAG: WG repeat-containing protein [Muribaculaceae bacterium]|nr:WG repeat-containing protein [Muribaculaceae bacterium]
MKKVLFNLRSLVLISAFLFVAIHVSAWDEKGPAVSGKTFKLLDIDLSDEICYPVKENGLWGFINDKGKTVIKPKYQEIGTPSKYKAITSNQKFTFDKAVIPVKLNGKWGFVGQNGKEIIKPKFDKVGSFHSVESTNLIGKTVYEPQCIAFDGNEALLIDINGKIIKQLSSGFSSVIETEPGIIVVQDGVAKFITEVPQGYTVRNNEEYIIVIDRNGYSQVYAMNGSPIMVESYIKNSGGNYKGMVLKQPSGYKIVDNSYNVLSSNDYMAYKNLNNYILLTQASGVTDIFECTDSYDNSIKKIGSTDKYISNVTKGYIVTAPNASSNIYGLSTISGKEIIEPQYSQISFSGNNIIVEKDGKQGLISITGEVLLPVEYTSISGRGNNNFLIENSNGVAVYNVDQRKETVPFGKYTAIGNSVLKGNAVWVAKGDKWGVATADLSREIVPPVYNSDDLNTGYTTTLDTNKKTFHVKKNGTVGVIGFNGKTIIPVGKYTGIKGYDLGHICVMNGNKVGLVDQKTGRQIVPPIHSKIEAHGNGHVLASDQTSNGYVAYVYDDKTGALLKKQPFTNSQKYSIARFVTDWLGSYYSSYDFEL